MNMKQINQEYEKLCAKVGDASYKIKQHELLLKSLYQEIDKLNELASTIQQLESNNNTEKSQKTTKQLSENE